jgi:hypothetical protein
MYSRAGAPRTKIMSNTFLRRGFGLVAATLACGTAFAQTSPADATPSTNTQNTLDQTTAKLESFEDMDRNRDDYVSRDEVPITHVLSAAFAQLDGNADNRLERAEFAKYNPTARPD